MTNLLLQRTFTLALAALIIVTFLPARILSETSKSERAPFIRDGQGRIVIYHGVCVSNYSKHSGNGRAGLPWHVQKDFDRLKEWGFNLVRYMMFWEAIEPSQGSYNEEYLQASIKKLRSINADVVIDMHQDLYCRKFGGNGFPEWSVHDGGKEFHHRRPWSLTYLEPAVKNSYSFFWKDSVLQSQYLAMLKHVMSFIDTIDNVIGLDVMNEPFAGNTPAFEGKILSVFYYKVMKTAAETGFRKKIFFEPWLYASGGLPTSLRFKPGQNCVYAPHYYDPFCHEGRPYGGINRKLLQMRLSGMASEAAKFGTPVVLGEFGISPRVPNYLMYLMDVLNLADQYTFGWVYYSYDRFFDEEFGIISDSLTEQPNMSRLVRVYPQRIAGDNPVYRFDKGRFVLEFDAAGGPAPTEIFIPARLKNVVITIDGDVKEKQPEETIFSFVSSISHKKVEITWE
jgi:endoglycosylceramidase